jgi:hypothetical protein
MEKQPSETEIDAIGGEKFAGSGFEDRATLICIASVC